MASVPPPSSTDPEDAPTRVPRADEGADRGVADSGSGDRVARPMVPAEPRRERVRRTGHKAMLYLWSGLALLFAFLLVLLTLANREQAEIDWVVGSATAPIALIVLGAAALGWLLGIATAALFARRTRPH